MSYYGSNGGALKIRRSGTIAPPPVAGLVERLDLPFNVPDYKTLTDSPFKVWVHYFEAYPVAYTYSQDSPTAPDVDTRRSDDGTVYGAFNSTANAYWRRLPGGNDTTFDSMGGEIRDYPDFRRDKRAAVTSPTNGQTLDYRVQDKITELRQMIAAGFDGPTLNMLDVPENTAQYDLSVKSKESSNGASDGAPLRWRQTIEIYEGAAELRRQGFNIQIMNMPDSSTNATKAPASLLVSALKYLDEKYPGVNYKIDGKFVLTPYQTEVAPSGDKVSVIYWEGVISGLETSGSVLWATTNKPGIPVLFNATYTANWTSTACQPAHKHLTDFISRWGPRDPDETNQETSQNRRMYYTIKNDYPGNKYMAPVSVGDARPREGNFWERDHTRQLIASWLSAIGDDAKDSTGKLLHVKADMVQIPTWNDIAEHAHIYPSNNNGWTLLKLCYYYLIWYKTGIKPTISRDYLALSHRVQETDLVNGARRTSESGAPDNNTYTEGQTLYMDRSGATTEKNSVGVTCLFTAPAEVTLDIGGRTVDLGTIAGGDVIFKSTALLPYGTGFITATVKRNGVTLFTVNNGTSGMYKVRNTLPSQDYEYRYHDNLPDPIAPHFKITV